MKMRLITTCLFTSFIILIAVQSASSQQQITLNFIGRNVASGLDQKLDSIQVKDLTKDFDTTLIGVQQFVIFGTTSVENPISGVERDCPFEQFRQSLFRQDVVLRDNDGGNNHRAGCFQMSWKENHPQHHTG